MRLLVPALLIPIAFGSFDAPVLAADFPAATKIDAVTVFPAGAEVKRIASIKLPAGSHTVVVSDLPVDAQTNSIRVEAKANGALELGTVDSRRLSVPSTDAQTLTSERKRIEDEIQLLTDERARIGAEAQAGTAQRTFVNNLLQLPARPPAPGAGASAKEDWGQILALIGRELGPINKSILDAEVRTRDVDRKIRDARGRLRALAPRVLRRTEVKIAVVASAPLDAEIAVSYQVAQASWQPLYDARLTSGQRNAAARLTITRRAVITQHTSEPWQGVIVSLSTTRPSSRTAAPQLRPLTVDFPPDRPPPAPVSMAPAPRSEMRLQRRSASKSDADAAPTTVAGAGQPALQDAMTANARIAAGTFQAIYAIGGRQIVPNAGQAKAVRIDETDFRDIALTARAVPRREQRAYLYAKLTVPRATPWLPGQIALFRDTTFVGNGRLPQLAPGQTHDIGFGADDRVRVLSRSTEERRGETGLISQSRTDLRNWRHTIKNLHAQPISIVIHDQVPVSNNQDIKVELIARPPPTKRDVEDRRGVLAWEDKLAPNEEKTFDFGYRVSWPAAKTVVYGR